MDIFISILTTLLTVLAGMALWNRVAFTRKLAGTDIA